MSDEVRRRREALGFSRQDVADRSHGRLTPAKLYRIERGGAPSEEELAGLSAAVGYGKSAARRVPVADRARKPATLDQILEEHGLDAPAVERLSDELEEVPSFATDDDVVLAKSTGPIPAGSRGVVVQQLDTEYGRVVDVEWEGLDHAYPALLHCGDVLKPSEG